MQYTQEEGNYSQWIFGLSIKKVTKLNQDPIWIARVAVKTSESPYIDGMDINFMIVNAGIIIEASYYENTPDFQGGSDEDCIQWLKGHGTIFYLQRANPYNQPNQVKVDDANGN